MNWIALKMLTGDRSKYLGLIFGVSFATVLMTQQISIFAGIMQRTALGISGARVVRITTEGALLGSLIAQGLSPELIVLSDGAGQFTILVHAACWVHAERPLARM